jgi:hypothetical protein
MALEMKRRGGLRILYPVILALLLMPMVGQVSAVESVTTLTERTLTVTGSWEKNNASCIPFAVDDFQGFRFINLSYEMLNPTAGMSITECGLVFKLITEEYFAGWRNGSAKMFVLLGEGLRLHNTGFITFDPRTNPEPSWQEGRYRLLVHMKPENCVNEAHIRIDLVRESEDATGVMTTLPESTRATTPVQENRPAESPAAPLPPAQPAGRTSGQVSAPPTGIPTQTPMQGYQAAIAGIFAVSLYTIRTRKP